MRTRLTAAALCVTIAACTGGIGGPTHPAGWIQKPASQEWSNPRNSAQTYFYQRKSTAAASLKDVASQVTIDVILRYPGAKFVRSDLFARCPGGAGLASFTLPTQEVKAAFAYWNGQSIEAIYRGPSNAPVDRSVIDAMAHSVCNLTA